MCVLALTAIPAFAGCGERQVEAGATPEQTISAWNAAFSQHDWDSLYDLAPPSERRIVEAFWAEKGGTGGKGCREVFAELMQELGERGHGPHCARGCTFERSEIEGISCRARCRCEDCRRELLLRREQCGWYVSGLLSPLQPLVVGK